MSTPQPDDDHDEDRYPADDEQDLFDDGDMVVVIDEEGDQAGEAPDKPMVPAAFRLAEGEEVDAADVEELPSDDPDRTFLEREALRRDRLREAREKLEHMRRQTPTMLIVLGVAVALLLGLLLVFSGLLSNRTEEVVIADATELAPNIRGTREEEDRFMVEIRNTEHRLEEINQRFREAKNTFDEVESGLDRMSYSLDDQLASMIKQHKVRLDKLLTTITDFIVAEGYREAGLLREGGAKDQR